MASLPSATTRLKDESGGLATGTDLLTVIAPVPTNDDITPRLFSGSQALYDQHGYFPGLDFSAIYLEAVGKPIQFVGLPIDTLGAVSRVDVAGNSGTSVVSVAAGGSGALEETDGLVKVITGGTIGTSQIKLELSLDGGRTWKKVRLGTASSYVIPYVGLTLNFAAGTLVADETALTWHSSAPLAAGSDITLAKTALAAQQKRARMWILIGQLSVAADATAIKAAIDAYETSDERYALVKCQLRDRLPQAAMSRTTVRMTGSPNLTFAEVGATGDTITRSEGSFVGDGFVAGDMIDVAGSVNNNISTAVGIATVTALVITLDTDDLQDEGPVADCTLTGSPAITFAEVGATGDTITRSRGSWLTDGFRAGDDFTIAGSGSNNITTTAGIDTVTASVITLDTDDLAAEVIRADEITLIAGETSAQAVATLDAEFASVTSDPRIDFGYGRGAMLSPVTAWKFRRPVQWADTILSFVRDIRTTTWWKDLGPIASRISAGFDLLDANGDPYEHDERTDGGALAAGFTCARTWGNGPLGAFIAQSLTRAGDASILSMTHNAHVANLAQTVNQATTENFVGKTLVLEPPFGAGSIRFLESAASRSSSLSKMSHSSSDSSHKPRYSRKSASGGSSSAASTMPQTPINNPGNSCRKTRLADIVRCFQLSDVYPAVEIQFFDHVERVFAHQYFEICKRRHRSQRRLDRRGTTKYDDRDQRRCCHAGSRNPSKPLSRRARGRYFGDSRLSTLVKFRKRRRIKSFNTVVKDRFRASLKSFVFIWHIHCQYSPNASRSFFRARE